MGAQKVLSCPGTVEEVYRDWGDPPPVTRPLMQGDVFTGVDLPDFDEQPPLIQVVMHPCTMRKGPQLASRIGVAPVNLTTQRVGVSTWEKWIRVMPLPQLQGPGQLSYLSDLVERTSVRSNCLDLAKRVAVLSDDGVLFLQQRMIMCDTRMLAPIEDLFETNRHIFTETELQEGWSEAALASVRGDGGVALEQSLKEFDKWLGEGKPSRRDRLLSPVNHSAVRREMYREVKSRYSS